MLRFKVREMLIRIKVEIKIYYLRVGDLYFSRSRVKFIEEIMEGWM